MTMPSTNPTYYRGDLRQDLLDEAIRLIAESGPSALSLRALSRKLGVSHAAPANHFKSKEDLFAHIARQGFELLAIGLREAAPESSDPVDRLGRLGLAYLDFASNHPAHFAVMFRNDLYDRGEISEAAATTFNLLVEACSDAQQAGWRPNATPTGLATLLWSVVHGYAHLEAEGTRLALDRRDLISLALTSPG